jgi:hypothetical protein
MSIILKLAKALFDQCVQGIQQQLGVVRERAAAPMEQCLAQVTSGVWRGTGADAFVEEVQTIELPGVGAIGDELESQVRNLIRAREIMEDADTKAAGAVRGIEQVFRQIVKF